MTRKIIGYALYWYENSILRMNDFYINDKTAMEKAMELIERKIDPKLIEHDKKVCNVIYYRVTCDKKKTLGDKTWLMNCLLDLKPIVFQDIYGNTQKVYLYYTNLYFD